MMRSARGTIQEPGTRVTQKSALNRSIADAAWSRFIAFLTYKAERAGGQLIRVKPHNTSNCCSRCNHSPTAKLGTNSAALIAVISATAITTPQSPSSAGRS